MIPLSEVKSHLKQELTDDDELISELEYAAVSFVERATGKYLGPVEDAFVERVIGNGTRYLYLSRKARAAPSTVVEYAYPGATETTITAAQTDGWELRGDSLVRRGGYFWLDGYEYRVTFNSGYVEPPGDLRQAVLQIIAHWYENREAAVVGTTTSEIPLGAQAILNSHRRVRI